MKITDVPVYCPNCRWTGKVIECDCDGDLPQFEDDGRLRCPKCTSEVKEK